MIPGRFVNNVKQKTFDMHEPRTEFKIFVRINKTTVELLTKVNFTEKKATKLIIFFVFVWLDLDT